MFADLYCSRGKSMRVQWMLVALMLATALQFVPFRGAYPAGESATIYTDPAAATPNEIREVERGTPDVRGKIAYQEVSGVKAVPARRISEVKGDADFALKFLVATYLGGHPLFDRRSWFLKRADPVRAGAVRASVQTQSPSRTASSSRHRSMPEQE